MDKTSDRTMPKEMASAANLMAHPLAGVAALSALGVGLASQTFGVWMGALTGMAEVSQRLFQPDEGAQSAGSFAKSAETTGSTAAKAEETRALIERTKALAAAKARSVQPAKRATDSAVSGGKPRSSTPVVSAAALSAQVSLMPEDFRQPAAISRPALPDDLKAISGIGPKVEQVLNGLGIWSYAQVAGWTMAEIAWVEDTLGFKGRIGRDNWLAQAAKLAEAAK